MRSLSKGEHGMNPAKKPSRMTTRTLKAKRTEESSFVAVDTAQLCKQDVFREIFHKGRGTAKAIAARLAKRGLKYRIKDVQQVLDAGVASGTYAVTNGETHLSAATLEIMR